MKIGNKIRNSTSWAAAITMATVVVFYGPGTLIFRPLTQKAHAAALSYITACSSASNSIASCSGVATGDLLVVFAYRNGNSGGVTKPAAFSQIASAISNNGGGTNSSANQGYKVAAGSNEGSGTWTNATNVIMQVYRGQSGSPIGNSSTQSGNNSSNTVVYGSGTTSLTVSDGSSWWIGMAGRSTGHANMATAPSGMTNRVSNPATPVVGGHDTNGGTASNWAATTVSGFSTSVKYLSVLFELKANTAINVNTSGSHAANLAIGSTDQYVGGAFTFVREIGSANVTSIKIRETGTVDAQNNLSNVKLVYKQEVSCSSTIPSGTTAFNSTPGTFNGSSDTTVTGTMSVDTSQVCVYVTLDVGSGASAGETIKLQITDPSADVAVSAGVSSPSSAQAISSSVTIVASGPATDQIMRHGAYFSGGSEQPFFWAN